MKLIVTGGNGYVGSHVIKVLLDMGHEVLVCDIASDSVDKRAQFIDVDIFEERKDIYDALGRPDICLHLAWRNGFVHNAPTQMGDLSAHYRFLTAID